MNSKIKLLIILVLLILLVLLFWFFFQRKNSNDKNIVIPNVTNNTTSEESTLVSVNFINTNSWNSENKNFKQYEVKITNNSQNSIDNWSIEVNNFENIQISKYWNSNFSYNESILKISSVDYNSSILPNTEISFGFIAIFNNDNEFNFNTNYKFLVNNYEYKINQGNISTQINLNTENTTINSQSTSVSKDTSSPLSSHGKLSVSGTNIIDSHGENFALKGVSTHGIAWFPQYVNKDAFKQMKDDWGINTIRIAMYSNPNDGYSTSLHTIVKNGIDYATELGLYVIVDWHILNDNNPNTNIENSKKFFEEISSTYSNNTNIIYEICNEPNGNTNWENDIKHYAEQIIPIIRKNTDSIIIVGTPNWSQDVDIVSKSPITKYSNIMYSLHFYAGTHKENLRNKLKTALQNNLPVFVSEFGICDASGNGNINEQEANTWIDFLNSKNISWICWNLSNKNESSSILNSNVTTFNNWSNNDLSVSGKWLLKALKK